LSRELVTIDRHAPVEFDPEQLKTQAPDDEALTRLFAELEFRQLQQEYASQDQRSSGDTGHSGYGWPG
jgi:DNA polymerase-1